MRRILRVPTKVCKLSTLCIRLTNTMTNRFRHRPEDPQARARVYDEHHRGVYAAAFRVLGNAAQAQDVAQDVFLRLWRRPQRSTRAAASSAPTCG